MSVARSTHERLPLFPLHTVLFPGERLPLRIFEPRYVDLVRDCLRDDTGFGIAPIKEGREAGAAAITYEFGTLTKIRDWDQGSDGLLHIVVEGLSRFRIRSVTIAPNQLSIATIEWLSDPIHTASTEQFAHLKGLLDTLVEQAPSAITGTPDAPTTASALAYRWAQYLPLSLARKAELLECIDDHSQLTLIDTELTALLQRSRGK
jgi:uncharacterized protein